MIKYFLAAFFTGGLVQFASAASPALVDSIGTVVKNGKSFIIHKVAPKETIYALARQYGVSVTQVQQANPGVTTLAVGQTVFVPGGPTAPVESGPAVTKATAAPVAPNPATTAPATSKSNASAGLNESGSRVHQVEARQTLFAVARLYNVSTADLKKWNNLTSDNLQEGQTLLISPPVNNPETTSDSDKTLAATEEEKTEAKIVAPVSTAKPTARKEETNSGTGPVPAKENSPVKEERTETRVSETLSRISESGLAEVMEKGEGSKYLALHKTAPVGTILQVKNALNNQSVYVRVSGKLPESTANDRVIIRVSKRAYQKLAATDSRFQVEINYMP